MKKADLLRKIEEIREIAESSNYYEGMDEGDWLLHYDECLGRIKKITDEILGL